MLNSVQRDMPGVVVCASMSISRPYGTTASNASIAYRMRIRRVAVAGVPFVDVMNTMCDPSIPLTTGEWEEWVSYVFVCTQCNAITLPATTQEHRRCCVLHVHGLHSGAAHHSTNF